MHLIDIKTLKEFWQKHPEAEGPLTKWYQTAEKAQWANLKEIRDVYPHADAVTVGSGKTATVFNIKGNDFRLITAIHYNRKAIFLMMVLTHKEYSTGKWKAVL